MLQTAEDKQAASQKLEGLIEQGRQSTAKVIEYVMSHQPKDKLQPVEKMLFSVDNNKLSLLDRSMKRDEQQPMSIHKNALQQMATVTGIPSGYVSSLQETDWGRELLARSFNDHFGNKLKEKVYLVRSFNDDIRGFLSDKYRRLDSRPIVEAFATSVAEAGAFPYKGVVTDTKINIQAIFPELYEPVPGELVAYGISLENSDFGNGALSLRSHMLRIWCSNLMVTEETMRQIHLGKRLDDAAIYSQETYRLDAETVVSAMKDVVVMQLSPSVINSKIDAIKAASSKELSLVQVQAAIKNLTTRGVVTKSEGERALGIFELGGVEAVPAGNTQWRLSNAMSWVAGQSESPERQLELTKVAGQLLTEAA